MKKITFTLKVEAEPNTISLMKEIDKISCGLISIWNITL